MQELCGWETCNVSTQFWSGSASQPWKLIRNRGSPLGGVAAVFDDLTVLVCVEKLLRSRQLVLFLAAGARDWIDEEGR